jgi:hypothetical protein
MLCLFLSRVNQIGLLNGPLPPRARGSTGSLFPGPEFFQEYEIRAASLSSGIFSPRSSFSSGLNSFRAAAGKTILTSVLSLVKRQSGSTVTDISIASDRSSWSFGAVTGLPSAPSFPSDGAEMDSEVVTSHDEEPQDKEMADA